MGFFNWCFVFFGFCFFTINALTNFIAMNLHLFKTQEFVTKEYLKFRCNT